MNQFSDSILAGIKSAQDAEANVKEIRSAIADMSEAVSHVTNGEIMIEHQRVPTLGVNFLADAIAVFADLPKDDVISFKRSKPPIQAEEVGRLEIPSSGYPCTVKFAGKKMACFDRPSLVEILKELLSSPEAGKALLKLRGIPDQVDAIAPPASD